jgi:hypothetical protein
MRVAVILLLAGCIEGPEPESVNHVTPRPCETGITSNQLFTVIGDWRVARQERLAADPPRFALESALGIIDLTTTVGEFSELTLEPQQPLPPDTQLTLRMVQAGALEGVVMSPGLFPVPYSTRSATEIRSYRAIDNTIFISFSQALDPTTLASSVSVRSSTTTATATAEYLDAPGHVVHVELYDLLDVVEIEFGPELRTQTGSQVFAVATSVRLDPAYTVPVENGCQYGL